MQFEPAVDGRIRITLVATTRPSCTPGSAPATGAAGAQAALVPAHLGARPRQPALGDDRDPDAGGGGCRGRSRCS